MQPGTASSSDFTPNENATGPIPTFNHLHQFAFIFSREEREKNSRARVVEDETRKPRDGVECNTVFSAVLFNHFPLVNDVS